MMATTIMQKSTAFSIIEQHISIMDLIHNSIAKLQHNPRVINILPCPIQAPNSANLGIYSNLEYRWKKSNSRALEICQSWWVSIYRLWKILLMVRGLHDSCCANQMLLRPCRFNSALIASPMWGSSFIPLPFAEPRPQKATIKKH